MDTARSLARLHDQLDSFDRQSRGRAKKTADETGLDLENRISLSLRLHEMIHDMEVSWGIRVRKGALPYDVREAEKIKELYVRWLALAKRILPDLKRVQADGRRLAHAQQLRDTIGFCYQARMSIPGLNKAFQQLERGEGIRLTEGSHGVRRRRAG